VYNIAVSDGQHQQNQKAKADQMNNVFNFLTDNFLAENAFQGQENYFTAVERGKG
jgi:hypothetical protein